MLLSILRIEMLPHCGTAYGKGGAGAISRVGSISLNKLRKRWIMRTSKLIELRHLGVQVSATESPRLCPPKPSVGFAFRRSSRLISNHGFHAATSFLFWQNLSCRFRGCFAFGILGTLQHPKTKQLGEPEHEFPLSIRLELGTSQ